MKGSFGTTSSLATNCAIFQPAYQNNEIKTCGSKFEKDVYSSRNPSHVTAARASRIPRIQCPIARASYSQVFPKHVKPFSVDLKQVGLEFCLDLLYILKYQVHINALGKEAGRLIQTTKPIFLFQKES